MLFRFELIISGYNPIAEGQYSRSINLKYLQLKMTERELSTNH